MSATEGCYSFQIRTGYRDGTVSAEYFPFYPDLASVSFRQIRDAEEGEEIYNTYGPLPNVVLLNKHGFVEIPNLNDCVRKYHRCHAVLLADSRSLLLQSKVSVDEAIIRAVAAKCLGNDDAATKRLDFCKTRKKVYRSDVRFTRLQVLIFGFLGVRRRTVLQFSFQRHCRETATLGCVHPSCAASDVCEAI